MNYTTSRKEIQQQGKVNQLEAVYHAFFMEPCTMLMVAMSTGIERANICRYVARFKRQQKIAVTKTDYCTLTRHRAGYYTTDPAKFPPSPKQLNLF